MTIYSFYIFDRHCNCIYNREYTHTSSETTGSGSSVSLNSSTANHLGIINKNNDSNTSKLLFGILYSLKSISTKLIDEETSPISNALKSFTLGKYRIHYLESLTNLKFILITDIIIDNLQHVLWELYSNYYIKNCVENSLSPVEFKQSTDLKEHELMGKISNYNFIHETDHFLQSLSVFE